MYSCQGSRSILHKAETNFFDHKHTFAAILRATHCTSESGRTLQAWHETSVE